MSELDPEKLSRLSTIERMKLMRLPTIGAAIGLLSLFVSLYFSYLDQVKEEQELEIRVQEFIERRQLVAQLSYEITSNVEKAAKLYSYVWVYYPPGLQIEKLIEFKTLIDGTMSIELALKDDFNKLDSWQKGEKQLERVEKERKEYLNSFNPKTKKWDYYSSAIRTERAQSSLIDFFISGAVAAETSDLEDGISSELKSSILPIVLGVLGLVYFSALVKTFFSSNPQNMNLAVDLVKTLTGFFIGVVTAILS